MDWFAKSRNGKEVPVCPAGGGSNWSTNFCWSDVSVSSGTPASLWISFGWKSMYLLVYVAPWNVKVGVFGNVSVDDDDVVLRLWKVPKRDSATIIGHRSAAQYGQ